jgi:cation diffusion facilitator CzcD-associated flavoprotein CzcO
MSLYQFYLFGFTDRNSKMALSKLRVCLVGAGPSGMSVMWHLNKLEQAGRMVPKLTCYEKQSDWGGLWNYSWRTGKINSYIDLYNMYLESVLNYQGTAFLT